MIWIVKGERSYQAIGINVAEKDGVYSLWIERPTGSTVKLVEGTEQEMVEYKEAVDYAVKHGLTAFEIK